MSASLVGQLGSSTFRLPVCGQPSDPHHLPFAQPPALGRKLSNEFAVPLCRCHHRELHQSSDEGVEWVRTRTDACCNAAMAGGPLARAVTNQRLCLTAVTEWNKRMGLIYYVKYHIFSHAS